MIYKSKYTVLFLLLLFTILFLGMSKLWVFINILILLVCLISYFFDKYFILFLFIIFLPTNGLVSTDYNFLGVLNLQRILNLSAIIVFLSEGKKLKTGNGDFIKYAKLFLIFFLIYLFFQETKNYLYQISDTVESINKLINRFIKHSLLIYSSILLVKHIKDEKINNLFNYSIYVAIIFLAITQILGTDLYKIGFAITGNFDEDYGMAAHDFGRRAGFYGIGWADQNSFGAFLAIAVGFILSKNETNNNIFELIPLLFICSISIVITGSRAAIFSLLIILLIYFFRNWTSSKVLFLFFLGAFGVFFVLNQTGFFNNILSRFDMLENQLNTSDNTTRVFKWKAYINFMFSNVDYLITGARHRIIILAGRSRAAHNLFIQIFYQGGVFFLFYYLGLIMKFTGFARLSKNEYYLPYTIIPYIVIILFVSDWSNVVFLAFFTALNQKTV